MEEEVVIKEENLESESSCSNVNDNRYCYCIVNNIPEVFHASDLRNYFSSFIETGNFDCFHFRHRPQFICNPSDNEQKVVISGRDVDNVDKTKKKLCCVVRFIDENKRTSFIKKYDKKFWMDKEGNDINEKCFVSRVKLDANDQEKFSKELQPPKFMPQGNVGTKNCHFLDLIRECRLPPSLIQKLGLEFPTGRRYKKFSKVPFDYKTTLVDEDAKEEEEVLTGKGHTISDVYIKKTAAKENDPVGASKEDPDESGPDDDDDRCEDWERHVTFEDDPTSQERIKERLYEEELELVWEKGGPGIVWYTDAQFWDEQEGGFDEKTSDNLDIDMQEYYSPGDGDKDARDMMDMRKVFRIRHGLDETSVFKKPKEPPPRMEPKLISLGDASSQGIGSFEKYTKGIGRKVMEKMGWKDGSGLGKSFIGMAEALQNEGQGPSDKRGIGFYGEKMEFKKVKKSHLPEEYDDEHRVSIATIYDNPEELDTEEPLLRSNSISYIKRYK